MSHVTKDFTYSLVSEISKSMGNPYWSESKVRFLFEQNDCFIEVAVGENGVSIGGFVAGAGLSLERERLSSFCTALKSLGYMPLSVEIMVYQTTKTVFSVFPRTLVGGYKGTQEALDWFRLTFSALEGVKKIVEEYRAYDKSLEILEKQWRQVNATEDKRKKGKLLEQLMYLMISRDDAFRVVEKNVRTKSEEIDLVVENLGRSDFFSQLRTPIILVECKNWVSKVHAKDVRDFAQKLQNRPRVLCNLGVLVALSGLTKDAGEELLGYRGKDFVIVTLNSGDIDSIVKNKMAFNELVRNRILEAGLR